MEAEEEEFDEEFVGKVDPSILHFLLASGDRISSKQLRDDLMTMLIAGHETTAAVLTWTMYCLSQHPDFVLRLQQEVRPRPMFWAWERPVKQCGLFYLPGAFAEFGRCKGRNVSVQAGAMSIRPLLAKRLVLPHSAQCQSAR